MKRKLTSQKSKAKDQSFR